MKYIELKKYNKFKSMFEIFYKNILYNYKKNK